MRPPIVSEDAEALSFLGRCIKRNGPRRGDAASDGRERLKLRYDPPGEARLRAGM
jgi:hypothetical protein